MICKIAPKNPLCLEKFETMAQLGRFTLRDEGKTIAVGKVLKYKPYSKGVVGANVGAAKKPASSAAGVTSQMASVTVSSAPEIVFNMDTGEASEAKPKLAGIAEGDEDAE